MAFSEFDLKLTMASIAICLLLAQSAAREVRPSDHGLSQQQGSPPTGEASPPEMLSFFGASSSPPASSPSSALPNVSDSTDSLWMHSSNRRDRVREILLVASLVCGVAGVALLIGSGLLCLFKSQKENRSASKSTSPRQRTLAPPPRAGVDNNCYTD